MPQDSSGFSRLLRKGAVVELLGIDQSTLSRWVKSGRFPAPRIINPGATREVPVWLEGDVLAWLGALPQREPRPLSPVVYAGRRRRAPVAPPPPVVTRRTPITRPQR